MARFAVVHVMGKMDTVLTRLFLLASYVLVNVGAVSFECPANLKHDRNLRLHEYHCYQFILDHPGDWFHADSDCRGKGGYLTDIHSSSEQAFIYNSLQYLGFHGDKGIWIGLTDKDEEGTWKWTSGANFNFNFWARGQPGTLLGGSEDCALLQISTGGTWHDYPCHGFLVTRQNHGWVCKFAAIPVIQTVTTTTQTMESATTTTSVMSTQKQTLSTKTLSQPMTSQMTMSSSMTSSKTETTLSSTTTANAAMSSTPEKVTMNPHLTTMMMKTQSPAMQSQSITTGMTSKTTIESMQSVSQAMTSAVNTTTSQPTTDNQVIMTTKAVSSSDSMPSTAEKITMGANSSSQQTIMSSTMKVITSS